MNSILKIKDPQTENWIQIPTIKGDKGDRGPKGDRGDRGDRGESLFVARTSSDMINPSYIYLYVGSQSGYTFGDWYYYDGSNWVSGGVYGTGAGIDNTLSVEGRAADAKAVGVFCDNNLLSGATWFQGTWSSFGDLSNINTESSVLRISTQIELTTPVNLINFVPITGAKFRVGLFDTNGTKLLAMSSFYDTKKRYEYKNIKYIRITLGLVGDGHISEYNGIVRTFSSDYYSLMPIGNRLGEQDKEDDAINQKLVTLFEDTKTIILDSNSLEVGTISNGVPVESTLRARTTNFIECPSSYVFILCPNQDIEYVIISYNQKNSWTHNGVYLTGSNFVKIKGTKFKIIIKYRQAPYNIDSSMLDTFGIYYSIVNNLGNNLRFTVMSHNCGKFNYGNNGGYSGDDVQEKIAEWKSMLAKYKPDILFSQELSMYFDSGSTINAFDTIYKPLFPFSYFVSYGRISTKLLFAGGWNEDLSVTYGGATYSRSCGCCLLESDGIPIFLCAVHLESGAGEVYDAVRELQRDKLLTMISELGFPYVIIGGDFNTSDDEFYDVFEEAEYKVANHGYFGTIKTHGNDSIDNIIVKGFSFYNVESSADDKCTSDHNPIVADIHLTML